MVQIFESKLQRMNCKFRVSCTIARIIIENYPCLTKLSCVSLFILQAFNLKVFQIDCTWDVVLKGAVQYLLEVAATVNLSSHEVNSKRFLMTMTTMTTTHQIGVSFVVSAYYMHAGERVSYSPFVKCNSKSLV